eukprot:18031-Heterococcus_DN1.PRE.3
MQTRYSLVIDIALTPVALVSRSDSRSHTARLCHERNLNMRPSEQLRTNGTTGTRGILTNGGSNTTNGSFNTETSYGGVSSLGSEEKADDWGYPLEQTTAEHSVVPLPTPPASHKKRHPGSFTTSKVSGDQLSISSGSSTSSREAPPAATWRKQQPKVLSTIPGSVSSSTATTPRTGATTSGTPMQHRFNGGSSGTVTDGAVELLAIGGSDSSYAAVAVAVAVACSLQCSTTIYYKQGRTMHSAIWGASRERAASTWYWLGYSTTTSVAAPTQQHTASGSHQFAIVA